MTYYPDALIDFLTIPDSLSLLENNPAINQIIVFDKRDKDRGIAGFLRIARQIASYKYNLCLVPHRSLRSAFLAWRSGAAERIGFDRSAWSGAFSKIVPYQPDLHEIDRNLSLLTPLGIQAKRVPPVVYPTAHDRKYVTKVLNDLQVKKSKRTVAVAPGSVWPTKRWPADYFTSLCRILDKQKISTLLIGSQADAELCRSVSSGLNYSYCFAGKLSLRQTYYLLTQCQGILTNDSAPLHLGMAAGIYVFSIFGPTSPAFGFAPFGDKAVVIENQELNCRPCAIHGGNKCPLRTFELYALIKTRIGGRAHQGKNLLI